MPSSEKETHQSRIASALLDVVKKIIAQHENLVFSKDPEIVERDIIEYDSRLRISGMEKFNAPCYICLGGIYRSQQDLEAHNAIGAIILYLEEMNAERLFKGLGFHGFHDDNEEEMLDKGAEFLNLIIEQFKPELSNLGYKNIVLSSILKHRNNIPEGVEFHYDEYKMHQLSFYLWKEKIFAIDITLASP